MNSGKIFEESKLSSKFEVFYTGLQEGITEEEFISQFCSKFGISEAKAQQIVSSTSDVVLKKDLDEAKGKKYAAAFESCGMTVRLSEIPEQSDGLSLEPIDENESSSSEEASASECPKCGSDQIDNDQCQACGIYISKYLENRSDDSLPDDSDKNPYATPEASLEKSIVSKEGQGSLEGGINGDYDFSIGDIFGEAWERTKGAKGSLLLAGLFYILVAIAINMVMVFVGPDPASLMNEGRMSEGMIWAMAPSFIMIPILYPIIAGIILMGIHRSVDADISASSVFSHYGKIIPVTILTILTGLFTMLGFMLLVLPGIYLAVAYMMAMALMIDRDMGVWEAMETSRKAITKHWFKIFFLYILLGILMMLAMIPMMIGLIWLLPFAAIMHGVMYKYMFGVESVVE